jgi:hypothetical protein
MNLPAPIEIITLRAYDGPNITGPQPGVLVRLRCTNDYRQHFKSALKDGALFIGLVIAYLEVSAVADADSACIITITFITPMPAIGAALARYTVASLCAHLRGDDAWDGDTPLFALQQQRRQEAPPMPLLQRIAEARARHVPVLTLPDGRMQLGYGTRGWSFDPAAMRERDAAPPTPPWERLGIIPIYAISGEHLRSATVRRVAACLQAQGLAQLPVLEDASFDDTLQLLADPTAEGAIIGLNTADMVRRGVAFRQCHTSIVSDCRGERPPDATSTTEWLQALGLPMLIATTHVVLNTEDAAIASLAAYAPHTVVPLAHLETVLQSAGSDTPSQG